MTILSVCNHKGGTGKTTTVIHLAAALGLSGRRVLAVDLDPQGFLTRAMDVEEPPPAETVAAFFDPSLQLAELEVREVSGFDLIPSSSSLTRRMRELNKPTDVLWVREGLGELGLGYDVVLFDTAAAVTVYSLNALVASRHVVIPVLPEYQSVVGSEQTYQTVRLVEEKLNPQLESELFLLTQVDGRKRMHQSYREYVRQKYGAAVMESVIRTSAALARTQEEGRTVFDQDPGARGAQDYASAAEELMGRIRKVEESSPQSSTEEEASSGTGSPQSGKTRDLS